MTSVGCWADECNWCENGWCKRGEITISEDWECESFEPYRNFYTDSYWIACCKDGEFYRNLVKNGKKIEYNGYVFYTKERITKDERYRLTEERTGYDVGEFRHLKGRWDTFLERVGDYPDVMTFPIYESEDTE